MISFGSDNHCGVHPEVLKKLIEQNHLHAPSYGTDDVTQRVEDLFKKQFGISREDIYFVFNGTAANILALAPFIKSYNSILCADTSHLHLDECGAPERHLGCQILTVKSEDGKISPQMIEPFLIRFGDQHHSQLKAVSITLPTEYGTCYTLDELKDLKDFCTKNSLFLHIDGARFIQAAHYLNCSFQDIIEASGASSLSFGGTKNGLLFGEAVLFFKKNFPKNSTVDLSGLKYERKQLLQLPSKHRFLSAQFEALLLESKSTPVWKEVAEHTQKMARRLENGLKNTPQIRITQKVEANSVFALLPQKWISRLKEQNFFYVWNQKTFEVRLMMSFDVKEKHIDDFLTCVQKLSEEDK